MKRFLSAWVLMVACVFVLSACDETDLGSVRIELAEDLSGTVSVIRVARTESATAAPDGIEGIVWAPAAASVVTMGGSFEALSELTLGGITFDGEVNDLGGRLEVVMPRGETVDWPALLTVAGEERTQVAAQLSGTSLAGRRASTIARTVKIEIKLPTPHISSTIVTPTHGVEASGAEETVTLVIPVERAYEDAPEIRWQVTW